MTKQTILPRERGRELTEQYRTLSAATVHEAMGRRGAVEGNLRPLNREMRLCGTALPVRCHPGDNLSLIKAISLAEPGQVIVLDMGDKPQYAPFGEVLMTECRAKGLAGLVTNSCVRDTRELIEAGFPVFSAGIGILGTVKVHRGTIGEPMSFGGVWVRPGDLVLGDADGLVIVPWEEAEDVLARSRERMEKEARVIRRLEQGESLFDIYGYQAIYEGQ